MTPGLAVDGETVSTGRLLSPEQVKKILEKAGGEES
ncbi:MAG: thioredoxin family protein [Gemmatimonadota bacterium]